MQRGKKYKKIVKDLDRSKTYSVEEGVKEVKKLSYSDFVGTLEVNADVKIPKDRDPKSIKGAIALPNSVATKSVRVAVFCTPDMESEAKEAGADLVGLDSLVKDVKAGKIDFDVAIATPSVMPTMILHQQLVSIRRVSKHLLVILLVLFTLMQVN